MSPELLLIAFMVGNLAGLGLLSIYEHIIAWRAERQLKGEQFMQRGFKAAKRMGWLPEDVQ